MSTSVNTFDNLLIASNELTNVQMLFETKNEKETHGYLCDELRRACDTYDTCFRYYLHLEGNLGEGFHRVSHFPEWKSHLKVAHAFGWFYGLYISLIQRLVYGIECHGIYLTKKSCEITLKRFIIRHKHLLDQLPSLTTIQSVSHSSSSSSSSASFGCT